MSWTNWPLNPVSAETRFEHCCRNPFPVNLRCVRAETESFWRCTSIQGAFYEAFPPEQARFCVRCIDFCYTPILGSWLNIAENQQSCLTRQRFHGRRIGELIFLKNEIDAWSIATNNLQRGADWQMKIADARCKLKSVYPKFLL